MQAGFEHSRRSNIHPAAQNIFEKQLQLGQLEKAYWSGKFDQEIHVAVWASPVARDGTEQKQGSDAKLLDLDAVLLDNSPDLFPFHVFRIA